MATSEADIWGTLLSSVESSTSKSLPIKSLLVLGGRAAGSLQFVNGLQSQCKFNAKRSKRSQPPYAPDLPTNYTYADVEDPETEDVLGRISILAVPEYDPDCFPAVEDYLNLQPIGDCSVSILLDWNQPKTWLAEFCAWIKMLQDTVARLKVNKPEVEHDLGNQMNNWEVKLRTFSEIPRIFSAANPDNDPAFTLPLEEGQFDLPLGLPLYCIAQNAQNMQQLEQDHGFRDEHFDFIQQVLRTIILRHGGTLIYTSDEHSQSRGLPLRTILQQQLPIVYKELSLDAKLDPANTIIRDSVYIPAGWDTWGKIRVLREGFDSESIARGWDHDLASIQNSNDSEAVNSTITLYEEVVTQASRAKKIRIDVQVPFVPAVDPSVLLEAIEQRQWQVRDSNRSGSNSPELLVRQDLLAQQPASTEMHLRTERDIDRTIPKPRSIKDTNQRSILRGPPNETAAGLNKDGVDKDEYVQAFFQNLLSRNNSERG